MKCIKHGCEMKAGKRSITDTEAPLHVCPECEDETGKKVFGKLKALDESLIRGKEIKKSTELQIYVAKFEKIEEYSAKHNTDLTHLHMSIHPVISEAHTTAQVHAVGLQPRITFQGKVIKPATLVRALRDLANMVEKEIDGKDTETLIAELGPHKG